VPSTTPVPLGRAYALASLTIQQAVDSGLPAESITPVGDVRRFAPETNGVALLAAAEPEQHQQVLKAFSRLPIVKRIIAQTAVSVTVATDRGPVRLYVAAAREQGAALVWHTGSRLHVDQLRQRALLYGLHFSRAQLTQRDGAVLPAATESELYEHLRLPYIAPELRAGDSEIDAAARGGLPALVSEADIRGDLHMHTSWSDGRDTVAEMAAEAERLGYEYIAITDHSQRSAASRKLSIEDIARQRAEIDAVRHQARRVQILHGVEADILPDGELDFSDDLLATFDIVLASLHNRAGDGPDGLMTRYMRAIEHPLVNVITHPANRSPAQSPGYDLDFDRLFAAAAATGTIMEIDGAPGHLDMDGSLAKRAVAAGVLIAINSDGHRADLLRRQMQFGVGTARRGWVEATQVVNTRSAADIRNIVARKRQRG
jgi:DNA polymerase (family 10)